MVYPDVEVVVQVNGSTICSDVTDTSCTVDLPRDVYNISITQSNDIGSSADNGIFDSESNHYYANLYFRLILPTVRTLIVEEEMFRADKLGVRVTVDDDCPEAEYPVLVTFGSKAVGTDRCVGQENVTRCPLSPGDLVSFSISSGHVSLGDGEVYCYFVSLNGTLRKPATRLYSMIFFLFFLSSFFPISRLRIYC